jgi:hypothetical protein
MFEKCPWGKYITTTHAKCCGGSSSRWWSSYKMCNFFSVFF